MDPTSVLPEEVVEQIFILLPVEDLLTCCLVSSSWRKAVNSNIVWKGFCHINIESVKSVVKPKLKVPAFTRLTPVCGSRIKYMKEIHLRNNFRKNKFVDYGVPINLALGDIVFLSNNQYALFHNIFQKNSVEVWDIREKPILVQTITLLLELNAYEFTSFGDCLLVLQGHLLQVYSLVDGTMNLKMCRIFDRQETLLHSIPASGIATWYAANFGLTSYVGSISQVAGKYFFGVLRYPSDVPYQPIMHIWDLDSGNKLNEEKIPVDSVTTDLTCNSDYLYITLRPHEYSCWDTKCKIISYDLKSLQYSKFYFQSDFYVKSIACKEIVVVLPNYPVNKSYTFLDSLTGNTIGQINFANPMCHGEVDVYNNIMAYSTNDTVTVIDIRTQNEVAVIQVSYTVFGVYLMDTNIVLVDGGYSKDNLEVWDIRKKRKLYTLHGKSVIDCGYRSRSFPKLFFKSKDHTIHIHHYW